MKKIVSLFLVCALFISMSCSSFAKSSVQDDNVSVLNEKYSSYDFSNVENVSKLYKNDVEFQKIVNEFTLDEMTNNLAEAVKMAKDKNNKYNKELNLYLDELKELGAIDANCNIIATTKAEQPSIQQDSTKSSSMATSSVPSFDMRGKCITNASTMSATYSAYYNLYLISSNYNYIVAAASAYLSTGTFFASKVKTGGEWDYKATLGYATTYKITYCGYTFYYTGEIIGNFHYGFTGATTFSDTVLLTAAGFVQILSGTSQLQYYSSYFDDPMDQSWIQEGIDTYDAGNI